MKVSKETEQKIAQLQLFEQNLQNLFMQRQTFQSQISEIENALNELEKTKDEVYKVAGNVMVKKKKEELIKDLKSKKEILDIRIKSIEKQENKTKERTKEIKDEVMKVLEK